MNFQSTIYKTLIDPFDRICCWNTLHVDQCIGRLSCKPNAVYHLSKKDGNWMSRWQQAAWLIDDFCRFSLIMQRIWKMPNYGRNTAAFDRQEPTSSGSSWLLFFPSNYSMTIVNGPFVPVYPWISQDLRSTRWKHSTFIHKNRDRNNI